MFRQDALASKPGDAMFDFYNDLRAQLAGRLEPAVDLVRRLNAALRDLLTELGLPGFPMA